MPAAPATDPRVDAYIERAAPFARPILAQLRAAVHAGCPGAHETIKWSMPFFEHDGKILAHMAAFKQHCAFGFWKGRDVAPSAKKDEAMGELGRLESPADLPAKRELVAMVKQAVARIDAARDDVAASAKRPAAKKAAPKTLPVPPDLAAALARNAAARATFEAFAPSKRYEYLEWLAEAKRDDTRAKRLLQTIEWLGEGKSRHWKYQAC
ncbi:MAG TPA: YdeI/OmpD-associated family protein [Burkholderiaceae bacterium]|nr:YdeI/OmpD-associated family protein [Burkholderiaceae bacterium]